MKIAIVQFPGSNCERETMLAVKRADMQPIEFLWNESPEKLQAMDGFIIVGGFSYEDRGRAGIIAALQPVMQAIKAQSELGKPVLGICNGAQILVESGLVPGLENHKLALALTENKRMRQGQVLGSGFYNAWVNMRVSNDYQRNAFTRHVHPKMILSLPVAHGEGRFLLTPALLQEVMAQGLHVFQYCDQQGQIIDSFPTNPNGSMANIAALSNKAGNVMAMMPHPERTREGDVIFQSMRDYLLEERHADVQLDTSSGLQRNLLRYATLSEQKSNTFMDKVTPLYYYPRPYPIKNYVKPKALHEWLVKLLITDNAALTVSQTLLQLGFDVNVKRAVHWEIKASPEELSAIQKSAVLFNDRKEKLITETEWHDPQAISYLVRSKEDILSQEKTQLLKDHFSLDVSIQQGVLWQFSSKQANITDFIVDILKTNIVFNPYAHDCYQYQT